MGGCHSKPKQTGRESVGETDPPSSREHQEELRDSKSIGGDSAHDVDSHDNGLNESGRSRSSSVGQVAHHSQRKRRHSTKVYATNPVANLPSTSALPTSPELERYAQSPPSVARLSKRLDRFQELHEFIIHSLYRLQSSDRTKHDMYPFSEDEDALSVLKRLLGKLEARIEDMERELQAAKSQHLEAVQTTALVSSSSTELSRKLSDAEAMLSAVQKACVQLLLNVEAGGIGHEAETDWSIWEHIPIATVLKKLTASVNDLIQASSILEHGMAPQPEQSPHPESPPAEAEPSSHESVRTPATGSDEEVVDAKVEEKGVVAHESVEVAVEGDEEDGEGEKGGEDKGDEEEERERESGTPSRVSLMNLSIDMDMTATDNTSNADDNAENDIATDKNATNVVDDKDENGSENATSDGENKEDRVNVHDDGDETESVSSVDTAELLRDTPPTSGATSAVSSPEPASLSPGKAQQKASAMVFELARVKTQLERCESQLEPLAAFSAECRLLLAEVPGRSNARAEEEEGASGGESEESVHAELLHKVRVLMEMHRSTGELQIRMSHADRRARGWAAACEALGAEALRDLSPSTTTDIPTTPEAWRERIELAVETRVRQQTKSLREENENLRLKYRTLQLSKAEILSGLLKDAKVQQERSQSWSKLANAVAVSTKLKGSTRDNVREALSASDSALQVAKRKPPTSVDTESPHSPERERETVSPGKEPDTRSRSTADISIPPNSPSAKAAIELLQLLDKRKATRSSNSSSSLSLSLSPSPSAPAPEDSQNSAEGDEESHTDQKHETPNAKRRLRTLSPMRSLHNRESTAK